MLQDNKGIILLVKKPSFLSILFLILLFSITATTESSFSPSVNYLIDCGSSYKTQLSDGRIFKSDRETTSLLSTTEDIQITTDSINIIPPSLPSTSLPLYLTARVFPEESAYTFYISKTGRLWIRLYFFPLPDASYNLNTAVFSVHTDHFVLLRDFSLKNNDSLVFKEYLVNVSDSRFSLKFKPKKKSFAFINAIEVVSAPDSLISDSATSVSSPIEEFNGLLRPALQVSYRVNVGGPTITPEDDTLSRTWEPDGSYNVFPHGSQNVSVFNTSIKYPQNGVRVTPLIAPNNVYATAVHMKDPNVMQHNFNLSWVMNVEKSYSYLIRMHFCDIVSKSLNQFYFNVFINGIQIVSALDLSTKTKALSSAFYMDFVLAESANTNGSILIQVGPANLAYGTTDAILNGIEVMKITNAADSLDGFFSVEGTYKGPDLITKIMKIAAIVGLALALIAVLFLFVIYIRWSKRPLEWKEHKTFSSWLLPFSRSKKRSASTNTNTCGDSPKSKHGGVAHPRSPRHLSPRGPERFFHFIELQRATQNFDKMIGVGGFGNVYLGTLEDGTNVAVKRGSGSSEQGINEFRTELNMLSKLRHRHLVSLIGYCDENSEMILVYDYMDNGPFRSHLYGANLPPLSWQKRLEICIGAARGLHYLHTGAAQSIIHRDVKTTNILLDENYVAKVSDFGLSKALQEKAQISTAVKGSFGYLDPEYFRSQQLTQKSDIYSFGVVLFEVLCARPVVCPALPREEANLADWVLTQQRRGMLHNLIDPTIADTIRHESLKTFVVVAGKCLADQGIDRPSMGDVLWHLEHALELQVAGESESANEYGVRIEDENNSTSSAFPASDVSDSTDTCPDMFSQMINFQGR